MASATQRALANRAIQAAKLIELWNELFQKEMHKQNAQPYAGATVTFQADMLSNMFLALRLLAREIRDLERNLNKEKIRGHRHPG